MTNFEKYLKYKKKYLALKNKLTGGGWGAVPAPPSPSSTSAPIANINTGGNGWDKTKLQKGGGWGIIESFNNLFNKSTDHTDNNPSNVMKGGWGLGGLVIN